MSIIIHQSRRIKDWNDEKKKKPFHCLTVEIKDKQRKKKRKKGLFFYILINKLLIRTKAVLISLFLFLII